MKKRKTILAAVVLLCVFLVGGAIAYFTDTEEIGNTFTIGNIDITLTEPGWVTTDSNDNGVPDASENLTPGQNITKDPTITNTSTANPAYVFAKVAIPCSNDDIEIFALNSIGSGWTLMDDGACAINSTSGRYEAVKVYNYGTGSAMTSLAAGSATPAVFSSVTVATGLTSTSGVTGTQEVVVTGYGIQTQGFESTSPADIYANF